MNEFTRTVSKLRLIIENSLGEDDDGQVKTSFKTFCSKVENDDGEFCYQGIKLTKFELTIKRAKTVYASAISNIYTKVEQIFSSFWNLLYFETFYYYLTLNHGQKMTLLALAIARSTGWLNIIWLLWKKNGCDVTKVSSEWTCLKTIFFQCCTTAQRNPTWKFGIEYSQIVNWWLSTKTSCTSSRSSWLYLLWTP